jgi:hypothetical protein
MAKRRITPEERADWAEARRRLGERIEYYEDLGRRERDRTVRRRERLQRLTLGLLGR